MGRVTKVARRLAKFSVALALLYFCASAITPYSRTLRERSIENQIQYLSKIMDEGYDDILQNRFPEGKIFSNALLALSVIQHCKNTTRQKEKYAYVVDRCVARILSDTAKSDFNSQMIPRFGMFYNAWSSYVMDSYQKSNIFQYTSLSSKIKSESKSIQDRLLKVQSDSVKILDSYLGSSWPADNLIGLLAMEDDSIRGAWLNKLFEEAGHESGLINHIGSKKNEIRGSSQALISYSLNKLNYPDALLYNKEYKHRMIENVLGVDLVKENEDGSSTADVDSGPVLFGYGASATIMNIKTQASFGMSNAKWSWAIMNAISLPVNGIGEKYHLLKQEPMFDLFMLWASVELY